MDRFTARITVHDGEVLELLPQSLSIARSLASPAQSVRASFPLGRWPRELLSLALLRNGVPFLEARPDRQAASCSGEGMALDIAARTKGAALLDNEAKPKTYRNITTLALFQELIAPHGFLLLHSPVSALPEFTVRKGWTLWDAFCTFTRRVHGLVPYVEHDMVRAQRPLIGTPIILGEADRPIVSLERTIDHYAPLSRVYLRNEAGEYTASVENPAAAVRALARTRYLVPAGEFAQVPSWDAAQRITRSMRELLAVRVTVPGYLEALPGYGVTVSHPQLFEPNLLIDETRFTLDGAGARTDLTLRSALYY